MRKATSDSGTVHLYETVDVRKRQRNETVTALCGKVDERGPFTGVSGELDEGGICNDCLASRDGDGDE